MRFIHTGDVHIGMEFKQASFGQVFAKKRRYEIKETFYKIVQRAKDSDVDFLFISGDLFEDDYITVGEMKEITGELGKIAPTRVILIAGNHDPIMNSRSKYSLMEKLPHVYIMGTHVDKISFEELGVDIYGLSWHKKTIKEQLFQDIEIENKDRINILLAHGDVYQKSEYLPIDRDGILDKGFDYIALGHIHKHDYVTPRMAYPGSPEPLDFSETGTHGYIEGRIEGGELETSFVPIAKREFIWLDVAIDEDMTLEDMVAKVECQLVDGREEDMYRVYFRGLRDKDIAVDRDYVKEKLEGRISYVEVYDETKPNYDLDRLKEEYEGSVIGQFIAYMQGQGLENEVHRMALYEGIEALLSEKVS